MATVKFRNVNKIYDNKVQAVFDFNLEVEDKEFVVFVGPSGCGKSTTLRMLAGLEEITSGEILIDDVVVNEVSPKDRDIAMVFQSYALYPHLSVRDNMAFALKIKGLPKDLINAKVEEAAELLGLTLYLKRKPKELSGGQRQRVALGRAIVRTPKVFLMDEPLSNLDAKLRVTMRSEIAKLHKRVGATTIYVTHDQTEAMTMADRIVVMKDGYVQQIGTPKEIYNTPRNIFVADFIGSPAMNFIHGKINEGKFVVSCDGKEDVIFSLPKKFVKPLKEYEGKEIVLGIRPEDIIYTKDIQDEKCLSPINIECDVSELLGNELIVYADINGQRVAIKTKANKDISAGDINEFAFDENKIHFFDVETTLRLDV